MGEIIPISRGVRFDFRRESPLKVVDRHPPTVQAVAKEIGYAAVLTVRSVLRNPIKRKALLIGAAHMAKDAINAVQANVSLGGFVEAMLQDGKGDDSNVQRARFRTFANPESCCYPCAAPNLRIRQDRNSIPGEIIPFNQIKGVH